MPNQKGGKKFKKRKKQTFTKKEFITKDPKEPEEYAVIKKVLGSKRYELLCQDGITRIGICRGKLRTRILVDDIVLVGLWVDMQEDRCSILHKYDEDDIYKLKSRKELSSVLCKEDNQTIEDDIFDYTMPHEENSSEEDKHELTMPPSESSSEEDELDQEINLDDI